MQFFSGEAHSGKSIVGTVVIIEQKSCADVFGQHQPRRGGAEYRHSSDTSFGLCKHFVDIEQYPGGKEPYAFQTVQPCELTAELLTRFGGRKTGERYSAHAESRSFKQHERDKRIFVFRHCAFKAVDMRGADYLGFWQDRAYHSGFLPASFSVGALVEHCREHLCGAAVFLHIAHFRENLTESFIFKIAYMIG